jgi:hypothetical protein
MLGHHRAQSTPKTQVVSLPGCLSLVFEVIPSPLMGNVPCFKAKSRVFHEIPSSVEKKHIFCVFQSIYDDEIPYEIMMNSQRFACEKKRCLRCFAAEITEFHGDFMVISW